MVYKELLEKYDQEIKNVVEKLLEKAEKNQANENDIFLVYLHGFKHPNEKLFRKNGLSPYMKGPDFVGHSLNNFLDFFNAYNESNFVNRKDFYKLLEDEEKKDEALRSERLSIEVEFMIYLKFWEADLILRRLYNLARLISGNDYQWDFNKGVFSERKTLIVDHIQKPLKKSNPKLFNLLDEIYTSFVRSEIPLRDTIAHSNYSFQGRNIWFMNDRGKQLNLSIESWEIIYHKTFLFGYYFFKCLNDLNLKFIESAEGKHFGIMIRIPERKEIGLKKDKWVKYDHKREDWVWYENAIKT